MTSTTINCTSSHSPGFLANRCGLACACRRSLYRRYLDWLMAATRTGSAALLYYCSSWESWFFVVIPGVEDGSLRTTLSEGGALRLIAYGTYDLTNQATCEELATDYHGC